MKHMKFVTGSLLALALFSFASLASPIKAFATEHSTEIVQEEMDEEEIQVILPDSLSEEDEKAINKMVLAYQRSRSAAPEQLEAKISNYFEAQYGTTRAIYVVEFKSQGNGSISGRLVYVLMGNDALKRLNQASNGFVVPETKANTGYAFDNWSYVDGVRVESNDLATYNIQGSSIFYAEFAPDTNGDGIPDHRQRQFNVQFNDDGDNGTLGGRSFSFVAFEKALGEGCCISEAVGFEIPVALPFPGYAFDHWYSSEGEMPDNKMYYRIYGDITIWPVFAVDRNYDGIPDHKQTLYNVDFIATAGGEITGNSQVIVSAWENGEGELQGSLEMAYPSIWNDVAMVSPNDGYMLEYWIDQNGAVFTPSWNHNKLWESWWSYEVKSDTVFVAVFTEDINGDYIPDYKQMFLNIDFMATSGGSLRGTTHYIAPAQYDEGIGYYVYSIKDFFPNFNQDNIEIIPDNGYMLDYWIDQKGNQYDHHPYFEFLHESCIDGDTVFVAVFAEDQDGNGIPDYRENNPV